MPVADEPVEGPRAEPADVTLPAEPVPRDEHDSSARQPDPDLPVAAPAESRPLPEQTPVDPAPPVQFPPPGAEAPGPPHQASPTAVPPTANDATDDRPATAEPAAAQASHEQPTTATGASPPPTDASQPAEPPTPEREPEPEPPPPSIGPSPPPLLQKGRHQRQHSRQHAPTNTKTKTKAKHRPPGRNPREPLHEPRKVRRRGHRGLRFHLLAALLLVLGFSLALAALRTNRAVHEGTQAKASLLRAEGELKTLHIDAARGDLQNAQRGFVSMRSDLNHLGPLLPLARVTPLVRVQLRGADDFADAGRMLAQAGLQLTSAAGTVVNPADRSVTLANSLDTLRHLEVSLDSATALLRSATARVASLNGYRLLGPIGAARADLAKRLPDIEARADSADQGLAALTTFIGASGPRHYLFLSQNPAEIRPTGGFIGTYGLLSAEGGRVSLDRYDAIEHWTTAHPEAWIIPSNAGSPFVFISPYFPQTLANVNAVPDWPRVAQLAMDMWTRGGEAPVDGVISVSTGFLARILAVIGPTAVRDYNETVTAANVVSRLDFYTRQPVPNRKEFVGAVAEAVLRGLVAAPASQWQGLGTALGQAFQAREAVAWTTDTQVSDVLAARGWDGTLHTGPGDFFFEGEFVFSTKNSRGIRRAADHQVTLRPDGSAVITTTITFTNPEPVGPLNGDNANYVTVYGPQGATLDSSSDPPVATEPAVAGHPAAGWFLAVPPLGTTTLKVVWDVPHLLQRDAHGAWVYDLRWMPVADHSGDTVHLRFDLPAGWRWLAGPPPTAIDLTGDIHGSWKLQPPKP